MASIHIFLIFILKHFFFLNLFNRRRFNDSRFSFDFFEDKKIEIKKKHNSVRLPSLFIPICRHFLSRHAWHWFRCALSTIHRPVPAWHLKDMKSMKFSSSKIESKEEKKTETRIKSIAKHDIRRWDWQTKTLFLCASVSDLSKSSIKLKKASSSNLHFDWKENGVRKLWRFSIPTESEMTKEKPKKSCHKNCDIIYMVWRWVIFSSEMLNLILLG